MASTSAADESAATIRPAGWLRILRVEADDVDRGASSGVADGPVFCHGDRRFLALGIVAPTPQRRARATRVAR
jgi:hypothetical protein